VTPARWPRPHPREEKLLHVDVHRDAITEHRVGDLPAILGPGDLLVLNDAGTLPASLRARTPALEVRLAGARADGSFRAVLFGAGDWRTPTEHRPPPPPVGGHLVFDDELAAEVIHDGPWERLVTLRFSLRGAALWRALFRLGRPVQYAYLDGPLELWHTQTAFAGRPWSMEQPSAARPLGPALLLALRRHGVALATLTHAAGLSSTGDAVLDAALPLPERYEVPATTLAQVRAAERVIAVGTTVVRALESAAVTGRLAGETDLRLDGDHALQVVDALYTGLHEPGTSHYDLLQAFAPRALLDRAWHEAERRGFLQHEFGDSMLITRP
jgi:S-adenosylmethionine:tRNA ribosyltransferase-isomerase